LNDTVKEAAEEFVIVAKAARLKQSTEAEKKFIEQWLR
jgi:guanylate kinase